VLKFLYPCFIDRKFQALRLADLLGDISDDCAGARLNTVHNLHYYQTLMSELRHAIAGRKFADYVAAFREARRKSGG